MAQPNGYMMQENPPSTARPVAGAVFEGVKGALKAWLGWTVLVGAVIGAGMGIIAAGAAAATIGSVLGAVTLGFLAGSIGSLFVGTTIAGTIALIGGAFGAAKGYSHEREMQAHERGAPPLMVQHAYAQGAQHGAQYAAAAIEQQMMQSAHKPRELQGSRPDTMIAANSAVQAGKIEAAQLRAERG
jgi:hypothetical protein